MKLGAYFKGSLSMRCVSKGRSLTFRSAFTVPAPKVMFGAKCPSMTSRWIWSAPPWSARLTASARCPRSPARIEGAIFISLTLLQLAQHVGHLLLRRGGAVVVWRPLHEGDSLPFHGVGDDHGRP